MFICYTLKHTNDKWQNSNSRNQTKTRDEKQSF